MCVVVGGGGSRMAALSRTCDSAFTFAMGRVYVGKASTWERRIVGAVDDRSRAPEMARSGEPGASVARRRELSEVLAVVLPLMVLVCQLLKERRTAAPEAYASSEGESGSHKAQRPMRNARAKPAMRAMIDLSVDQSTWPLAMRSMSEANRRLEWIMAVIIHRRRERP